MAWLELPAKSRENMEAACLACGLLFSRGGSGSTHSPLTPRSMPTWLRRGMRGHEFQSADHIIQVSPEKKASFAREPYIVRAYEHEDKLVLVWENHPDGLGLAAFFGLAGERFLVFLARVTVASVLEADNGMVKVSESVSRNEYIAITYHERDDVTKQITIRISPVGETTFKTQGYEGAECQKATKALEEALGQVVEDTATDEMYRVPEQTQEQHQIG